MEKLNTEVTEPLVQTKQDSTVRGADTPDWGAPVFVWAIWTLLLLGALAYHWTYSHNIPHCDDWESLPRIIGDEPITFKWMWEQVGEHRCFLAKAAIPGLLKLAGGDFRAPLYFDILAVAGLAFAMIRVAKHVRGWTSYADAFLALALLYLPFEILHSWPIFYLLPMLLTAILFLIFVQRGAELNLGSAMLAGICLILLPLGGAAGLLYMPAPLLWFVYSAVQCWRQPDSQGKRTAVVIVGLALAAVCVALYYFFDYDAREADQPWHNKSVWGTLTGGMAFLTSSFGPGASEPFWPFSGLAMLSVLLLSAVALVAEARGSAQGIERGRALFLLCFIGGMTIFALGHAWGRMGEGLVFSYYVLAVPTLFSVYFVWVIFRPQTLGRLGQMCLFTLINLAVFLGVRTTVEYYSHGRHPTLEALERDLLQEAPPYVLIARYGVELDDGDGRHVFLADSMRLLHRKGIGPFRNLHDDPPFQEIPLSKTPVADNEITWHEGTAHGSGADSYLTFALPEPRYIAGIRFECSHSNAASAKLRVFWRSSDQGKFPENPQYYWAYCQQEHPVTIYVADTIDEIRIHPDDKAFEFSIVKIDLLVPDTGEQIQAVP